MFFFLMYIDCRCEIQKLLSMRQQFLQLNLKHFFTAFVMLVVFLLFACVEAEQQLMHLIN